MTITSKIAQVKAADLSVDMEVQRMLNRARVDDMVEKFNPDALGVITVSHRSDGTYRIVDGQHRWAAATKFGMTLVQAKVYEGLSIQDEAALFRVLNNTKIVNALDRFRVRVVEGEKSAVDIHLILGRQGWRVPASPLTGTTGVVNSPVALEWVYNGAKVKDHQQPQVLRQVVEVITAAWGYDPDGMRSDLVRGLGLFLTRYEGLLELGKVVRSLAMYPGGPLKLQADGAIMRSMRSSSAADSIAAILTNKYNHKRSIHRLPEWFSSTRVQMDKADAGAEPEED